VEVGNLLLQAFTEIASTEPTEITFTNRSTVTLSVYWLNYQGRRAF
jgi:hypothetical protein